MYLGLYVLMFAACICCLFVGVLELIRGRGKSAATLPRFDYLLSSGVSTICLDLCFLCRGVKERLRHVSGTMEL
jgi:hypothetical protein